MRRRTRSGEASETGERGCATAGVGNPNAPADVLAVGLRSADKATRIAAAKHPLLSEDAAKKLSRSRTVEIENALAGNVGVPERLRVAARMRAEALRTVKR